MNILNCIHRNALLQKARKLMCRSRDAKQRARRQRGFTLLEILIVVAFIGILAWIYAPKLLGSTDNAKSLAYQDIAQAIANTFRVVNQSCGTANLVATSAVPTVPGADGVLQLLVDGSNVNPAYRACYDSTNALPMHGSIQGAPGNYRLGNSAINVSDAIVNGRNALAVQFTPVTDGVVLFVYQRLSSAPDALNAQVLPTAGDTTDPKIQFSAGGTGTRTMTLFY